eukprot:1829380-Amphidinium_carterae.2
MELQTFTTLRCTSEVPTSGDGGVLMPSLSIVRHPYGDVRFITVHRVDTKLRTTSLSHSTTSLLFETLTHFHSCVTLSRTKCYIDCGLKVVRDEQWKQRRQILPDSVVAL